MEINRREMLLASLGGLLIPATGIAMSCTVPEGENPPLWMVFKRTFSHEEAEAAKEIINIAGSFNNNTWMGYRGLSMQITHVRIRVVHKSGIELETTVKCGFPFYVSVKNGFVHHLVTQRT